MIRADWPVASVTLAGSHVNYCIHSPGVSRGDDKPMT